MRLGNLDTDQYIYAVATRIAPHVCWLHPNHITILGLLCVIPILYNVATQGSLVVAIILVLFRGLLDCLDGTVARICKKTSTFGAQFDIAADFVFALSMYLFSCYYIYIRRDSLIAIRMGIFIVITWVLYKMYEMLYGQLRNTQVQHVKQEVRFLDKNSVLLSTLFIYVLKLVI